MRGELKRFEDIHSALNDFGSEHWGQFYGDYYKTWMQLSDYCKKRMIEKHQLWEGSWDTYVNSLQNQEVQEVYRF